LVVEGLKMLFSKLPKYRWLEKVAHGVPISSNFSYLPRSVA